MAGRTSSASVNYTLTNYAVGLMNDLAKAREIVDALCPTVVVPGATGQYKTFDDVNSFTVYNTARGLGGVARRIEFAASDGSFDCKPQALEVTVDDHERERANGAANATLANELLDQGKVRALLNSTALSHAKKIVDFVGNNTTALANRGNWSNKDIDPIDQLNEALVDLVTAVGSAAGITFTIGLTALKVLIANDKVKARARGVRVGDVGLADVVNMLIMPVRPVVGVLSYNTAKIGQTASKSQVLGSIAYLSYSVPNPTAYDPSPFKVFTTGQNNIEAVRTYRDESARSDVHAVDWSEDMKATGSAAYKRFDVS